MQWIVWLGMFGLIWLGLEIETRRELGHTSPVLAWRQIQRRRCKVTRQDLLLLYGSLDPCCPMCERSSADHSPLRR